MLAVLRGVITVIGRVLLCAIFFTSAVGQKIPKFSDFADIMEKAGMPVPKVMLVGAIVFLIVGSLSVIVGYKARIGAFLLLVFLVLATYYFHNFWAIEDPAHKHLMLVQFMKNLSMAGAMLIIIANGPGPMSFDARPVIHESYDTTESLT